MNWSALDADILGPAMLAGLIVLATHAPLGRWVLERGVIFIDLAVAQLAGLGVIAAHALGMEARGVPAQAAAFISAIAGALLLCWTGARWPDEQEAVIGGVFVLGATAALLLLAQDPMGGEHLKDLLAGQILWLDYQNLLWPAAVSAGLLAAWFGAGACRSAIAFYGIFAVAVTTSVQLVGVYLVFASLILPALAGRFQPARIGLRVGYAVGVVGYAGGLVVSSLFDLPAGPLVVWALAASALGAALIGRGAGGAGA